MLRHPFSLLLPFIAGGIFVAGLAPFNVWPLVPLSQAVLAWCWLRWRDQAPLIGFLYGCGFFIAGASWVYVSIHVHGNAPPLLAAAITGIFCCGLALLFALQGWCYRRLVSSDWLGLALGFPALWVAFEWLRSWLLTGFPWLFAGYAALDTPLAGWAPLVGVFGLSTILAAAGSGLIAAIAVHSHKLWLWLLAMVAVFGSGHLLQHVEWTAAKGQPVSVAAYQPNIPLQQKWDRRYFQSILNQYRQNLTSISGTVDLLLWPESAIPAYQDRVAHWLTPATKQLAAANTGLITGIPTREQAARYNSIIGLGRATGSYHKQKLVPFGEYVPLEHWLRGLIDFFDLPMSSFVSGQAGQGMLTLDELSIATFICYEIVYPDFVARHSRNADLLITVSNDSWFGRSIGPLQHLQMARFRALETGRHLLRGTNNGVTAIIDHKGRTVATIPQFMEDTLFGELQPRAGVTPYVRFGSWPTLGLALIALWLVWRRNGSTAAADS